MGEVQIAAATRKPQAEIKCEKLPFQYTLYQECGFLCLISHWTRAVQVRRLGVNIRRPPPTPPNLPNQTQLRYKLCGDGGDLASQFDFAASGSARVGRRPEPMSRGSTLGILTSGHAILPAKCCQDTAKSHPCKIVRVHGEIKHNKPQDPSKLHQE